MLHFSEGFVLLFPASLRKQRLFFRRMGPSMEAPAAIIYRRSFEVESLVWDLDDMEMMEKSVTNRIISIIDINYHNPIC